jgi:hypothetical protein
MTALHVRISLYTLRGSRRVRCEEAEHDLARAALVCGLGGMQKHTRSDHSTAEVDLGGCSINASVDATHSRVVEAVSTGIDLIVVAADLSKNRCQPAQHTSARAWTNI